MTCFIGRRSRCTASSTSRTTSSSSVKVVRIQVIMMPGQTHVKMTRAPLSARLTCAQIRPSSVTALRSSANSAVDLSIRPRENSSISKPLTIVQLPPLVVTGNEEIKPSGTP
ncbi:Uncharacterised protein [Mycobacterium tuberculosis]|nr:Uncharacterised protein [Mycobacterium tuberculosis]